MAVTDEGFAQPEDHWRALSACQSLDPAIFFPTRGEDVSRAKAVCAGCPVRSECLDHALAERYTFGIWGGKSERERRQMRRLRKLDGPAQAATG